MKDMVEKIEDVIKEQYGEDVEVKDLKVSFRVVSNVVIETEASDEQPAAKKRGPKAGKKRGPKPGPRQYKKRVKKEKSEVLAGHGADPLY